MILSTPVISSTTFCKFKKISQLLRDNYVDYSAAKQKIYEGDKTKFLGKW